MEENLQNNYIKIILDEPYLVGTKFELKSGGIYEDTTVTCLSGDSIFTSQVYAGSIIVLKNNENSFIKLAVQSVTNDTTLVVENDNYDNVAGRTYKRACLKQEYEEIYLSNSFSAYGPRSFVIDPSDNKILLFGDIKGRFLDFYYDLFRLVSLKPYVVYDPAGIRGLNDLTIPINPINVDGNTSIKIVIDAVAIAQVTTIATVADSSGNLDNKYFVLSSPNNKKYTVRFSIQENSYNNESVNPNLLSLENSNEIVVTINENDTANAIATTLKNTLDDHDDFSASVSTNTVTVTCATAGKVGNIFDPGPDKTATTISARNLNKNYAALFDSASGFSTVYQEGQKVTVTTEGGIIDGVYTIMKATADRILFKETFPENEDSLEPDDFSADDLGSVTMVAGGTGFTITSNGTGSSVVGKNDTFKTSVDGGANFIETGKEILGDHVIGGRGDRTLAATRGNSAPLTVVNFKNIIGHTLNDAWAFIVKPGQFTKIKNSLEELLGLPEKRKGKPSDIYKY
jgi:hypothetical protein